MRLQTVFSEEIDVEVCGHTFKMSSALTANRAEPLFRYFLLSLGLYGDVAEFGVYKGETSREMVRYCERHTAGKFVHLFDTFEGFPECDTEDGDTAIREFVPACSQDGVRATLEGLTHYILHPGTFASASRDFHNALCFAHIDPDLYRGTVEALRVCNRLVVPGGYIVIDDYGTEWVGVTQAVDEYLSPEKWDIVFPKERGQLIARRK